MSTQSRSKVRFIKATPKFRRLLLGAVAALLVISISLPSFVANGQSLEELKSTEAYQRLLADDTQGSTGPGASQSSGAVLNNYNSIWQSPSGARLLAQWIDAKIPNHRVEIADSSLRGDCASVELLVQNRQAVRINITIQVPKPQYKEMAKLKTLASFNRFRPPSLPAEGSQKVAIQSIQADFYRVQDGSCSLLIPLEQQGVVNLKVSRCTDSVAMFEAAKVLNLSRLNQKLTS